MTEDRCWLALADARPASAWAAGELEGGGWLVAWLGRAKPVKTAQIADPRAFDPEGTGASASLLLVPPERSVLFDDPAVQRARQLLYAHADGFVAVTTLSRSSSEFGGSLVAWREGWVVGDPFAVVERPRRLTVGPGLIAAGPPPALPAPVLERYGGRPWPADRFPS